MKNLIFNFLALCLSLFSSNAFAEDIKDSTTGVSFPRQVTFTAEGKEYQLDATGVATRKKLIISVYSIASYIEGGIAGLTGDKFEAILNSDKAKQLTMKWVHDASKDKVSNGYQDSFKTVFSEADYSKLQKEINDYIQLFSKDVQKGDEHIIRWLPNGYVEVIINGQKAGSLVNKDFAKGLWSIWFGAHSVVDRNKLVQG